jgi:bifunctional UDP-N-acetylglucosamine pyrophosphorylase/glucosamine-1-phosphate N-acetyltransferase
MRSAQPKVLHRLAGQPMLWYVLTALRGADIPAERTTIVIGDGAGAVRAEVERHFPGAGYTFALQERQLGTGHAVLQARSLAAGDVPHVVVAYGDTPLLQAATVAALLDAHARGGRPVTLATGQRVDPEDLGRIVRGPDGQVQAIVEFRDATDQQRALREVNSGFCAFEQPWLWEHLPRVAPARNGEIYLTGLAGMAVEAGSGVSTLALAEIDEAIGVNTRAQLAGAEATLRGRLCQSLMLAGVTLQDPATTYVDAGVEVGGDTVILANTHLAGATRIGEACEIGPNSIIRDSAIGDRCRVLASALIGATLEDDVTVGPYAHLRPGTRCGRGAEVGTGSEIKGSTLGPGSKMHHFGYLGDAMVGQGVNVGAGTVTCNYDGEAKHATAIGDGSFLGRGTLLVAPVRVGAHALTGAGAVVLDDVAEGAKVAGVPARPIGVRKRQAKRK